MNTAADLAAFIVDNMSADDIASFERDAWLDGVSAMQADGFEDIDTDDVLDAIEAIIAAEVK